MNPWSIGFAPDLQRAFNVGIEADGGRRRDHEELADGLERRGEPCRNESEARKAGHGQEAQNEPREDGLHVDLHARALCGCFLFLSRRLMAAKTRTVGMMARVLVSLTMVAKSPAASLKA